MSFERKAKAFPCILVLSEYQPIHSGRYPVHPEHHTEVAERHPPNKKRHPKSFEWRFSTLI